MGFTGLARWVNAPTTGLELIKDNIMRNHGGTYRGKWSLSVKSYRSVSNMSNGSSASSESHMPGDRTMCTVTMNDNAFVLLEDPSAPMRTESADPRPLEIDSQFTSDPKHAAEGNMQGPTSAIDDDSTPPHYRTTFLTVTPPQSLEILLSQLKARWVPVRQAGGQTKGQGNMGSGGTQLIIEGNVFAIGTDWLVRAGNVVLTGGAVKGMLLEAEYLPLHVMPVHSPDGTSELLSNLFTSLLPRVPDSKTVAVTIPEGQWEEVLYSGEDPGFETGPLNETEEEDIIDDIYVYGTRPSRRRKGDWQGIDRDRRAAFLIIGALKSEALL